MFKLSTIKKFVYIFLVTVLISGFFSSCSKNDSDDANAAEIEKVKQMLNGKWNFVSYSKNYHHSDKDNITTTTSSPGDYFTFSTDGKLSLRLLGYDDVSTYSVLSKTRILLYGVDPFDIKTLSATQLELYRKDVVSTQDYYEETYLLQR